MSIPSVWTGKCSDLLHIQDMSAMSIPSVWTGKCSDLSSTSRTCCPLWAYHLSGQVSVTFSPSHSLLHIQDMLSTMSIPSVWTGKCSDLLHIQDMSAMSIPSVWTGKCNDLSCTSRTCCPLWVYHLSGQVSVVISSTFRICPLWVYHLSRQVSVMFLHPNPGHVVCYKYTICLDR